VAIVVEVGVWWDQGGVGDPLALAGGDALLDHGEVVDAAGRGAAWAESASGVACGWTWRPSWNGTAAPMGRPWQRTSILARSNGSKTGSTVAPTRAGSTLVAVAEQADHGLLGDLATLGPQERLPQLGGLGRRGGAPARNRSMGSGRSPNARGGDRPLRPRRRTGGSARPGLARRRGPPARPGTARARCGRPARSCRGPAAGRAWSGQGGCRAPPGSARAGGRRTASRCRHTARRAGHERRTRPAARPPAAGCPQPPPSSSRPGRGSGRRSRRTGRPCGQPPRGRGARRRSTAGWAPQPGTGRRPAARHAEQPARGPARRGENAAPGCARAGCARTARRSPARSGRRSGGAAHA
jgi:hypothetical protein